MMSSRGHVEDDSVSTEGRSDDSNVRQVCTAEHGMVRDQNVAAFEFASPHGRLLSNASRHTTKMDRKMWSC